MEPFHPEVPQVHLHGVSTDGIRPLDFVSSINSDDAQAVALDLVRQALGFQATYKVKDSYTSEHNMIRHVYLKQTAADGLEIFNADLNVNVFNKKALNIGHTFYKGSTAPQKGGVSSLQALQSLLTLLKVDASDSSLIVTPPSGIAEEHKISGVKGALSPANIRAGYLQVENGKRLEPVWDIQIDMDTEWWNAFVSRRSAEVLALYDWVNDVNTYNIYPPGVNDPDDGPRSIVYSPATTSSPLGWHNQGNGTYTTTIGNNVYAQSNPTGGSTYLNNPRPQGTPTLDFNFPIDFTQQPPDYVNASTTNLFAWNNYIHDIFYSYGFNEISGNFQENNFNRGGLGNDSVIANCQDGSGTNNANFATPPDGQRPRMRMYVWTLSTPRRDGDLEDGIIIHEYAHGISNRLTGGPQNSNCLGGGEAGGMGEGWGDFFATVIRQRATYVATQPFPMGAYSANNPGGIRRYPYSTDFKIDPETYGFINGGNYTGVHAKGEVWCGILWQAYWNLVHAQGWSPDLSNGEGGNNQILQDVIDGMKLQPCNPNFVDARNAILLADTVNYGGVNVCNLWRGFAIRGLGVNAVGGRIPVIEDFTLPSECQ